MFRSFVILALKIISSPFVTKVKASCHLSPVLLRTHTYLNMNGSTFVINVHAFHKILNCVELVIELVQIGLE